MLVVPVSSHAKRVSPALCVSHWIWLPAVVAMGNPPPVTSAIVRTSNRRIAPPPAT